MRAQRRDKSFAHKDAGRFKTPHSKKSKCSKLFVGEETVQDSAWCLLNVRAVHFRMLADSRLKERLYCSEKWMRKTEELDALSSFWE